MHKNRNGKLIGTRCVMYFDNTKYITINVIVFVIVVVVVVE